MMEYYQITKHNQNYKGVRLFRFDFKSEYVTTIVLNTGDVKKGKGHYVGIYLISKESFLSNYFGYYVEKTTKLKWDKTFQDLTKRLK